MIELHLENISDKKIGQKNGLSEKELKDFCKKNQNFVDHIFNSQDKAGFHFVSLPEEKSTLEKIKGYAKEQKENKWTDIVLLGIGGSALGTIAVKEALISSFSIGPKLHVVDNIDPAFIADLMENLNFSKTLFIVISKSGTTTEPMALYALIKEKLLKKFSKTYQKHLLFITDPEEGILREMAEKEGIQAYEIPSTIGGRFSVLTNVGLIPCALAGINIEELMKGAATMKNLLKKTSGYDNLALKLASIQYLMDREKKKVMTVLMPYSHYLFRVGDWYRQLLAESIGKNLNSGPTPINALGTTDQHSQLQLYNDGPNNKFIIFMRVMKHLKDPKIANLLPQVMGFLNGKKMSQVMDAAYLGTAQALAEHQRPNITLEIEKVDAFHIGALFMLFEFQVALLGFMYKVNAFDQPGVEHSKIITKKILNNK